MLQIGCIFGSGIIYTNNNESTSPLGVQEQQLLMGATDATGSNGV